MESLRGYMPPHFVDSVMKWIISSLTPFERLWLNHKRLHVEGFNTRTTSVGKGMHYLMKNGYDGVRANQSPHISAGKMMDKSIKKCKDIEIFNAHELNRNRTQKHGMRGEYLTDYAYKYAENELFLSKSCRAMKVSNTEYCVYAPDDIKKKRGIIPKFYRMRRVKLMKDNFVSCSCGLSSRMKLPCRHIMSVNDGYVIEMFALRWQILYQHAFLKLGYEK